MKMIIEISGGVVTCVSATQECSIYVIDHDNLKQSGGDGEIFRAEEAMQPDFISWEEGEQETPIIDACLDEALQPYRIEMEPCDK